MCVQGGIAYSVPFLFIVCVYLHVCMFVESIVVLLIPYSRLISWV